jgi:ATP phosphoribosyltransferase
MLTVALPKGKIAEETLEIFTKIFSGEFKFKGHESYYAKINAVVQNHV